MQIRRRVRIMVPVLMALALPLAAGATVQDESKKMTRLGNSPNPTTTNSDIALWGDLAVAGDYRGLRVLDVSDPNAPAVLSDFTCSGGQGDVSIWGNLVFRSIDTAQTTDECQGSQDTQVPGFEGIRIIDISNPHAPSFVKGIATDCGSHTHTLIPDLTRDRVLLYVSSYPLAGPFGRTPYGTNCRRLKNNGQQGHSKISIIAVPLAEPERARVIAEPLIELSDFSAPGLRGCHDITVFLELQIAAAACLSEGQIWDISSPLRPVTLNRIFNDDIAFWHGAAFSWDGRYVAFGDEKFPLDCGPEDPDTAGAIWFHEVANPATPLGHFQIPRPQHGHDCTAHNFNVIPGLDRYILVTAAYAAGTSVVDFTDPTRPREIAYYDAEPTHTWSSYWYNGRVYANDVERGVDIFKINARSTRSSVRFEHLNAQTQEEVIP